MTEQDTITLYPQSSCPCDDAIQRKYPMGEGFKSNLSVPACNIPQYFDLFNTANFGNAVQPQSEKIVFNNLNPDVYYSKLTKNYIPIKSVCNSGCEDITYINEDPRLKDAPRSIQTTLDRPPITGDVRLKDIYDDKYNAYRLGYIPYKDIVDGQINYYVDNSIKDALYKPVFSEEANVQKVLYKDPMGAMKPEYTRQPLINTLNPTTYNRQNFPYGLSYMQDTQSHREDIMSYQQRKNNQQKWSARWE